MVKTVKTYTWDELKDIPIPKGKILAWWSDNTVTFLDKMEEENER